MSAGLLGRRVEVEIGVAGAPGRRITGLRTSFRVRHSGTSTPNEAQISVYNVAPPTLALAQQPGATVRLLAGYETGVVRQIFAGDLLKRGGVEVRHQGSDRVVTLNAADGLAGLQRLVSISAVAGVTVEAVLGQVLAQTGWARGVITVDTTRTLPQGLTHVGPAGPVLDRLAGAGSWQVRDGALYMTAPGVPLPEQAPRFSAAAGTLVGSPQPTEKGVQITALLDAGMRPGRRFVVEASSHSGVYEAREVTFEGDSGWETPFYVTVLGVPA